MIDDDDVMLAALGLPIIGPISGIVFVIVVGLLSFYACENGEECGKKHCEHGKAELMHNQCLCVMEAK
jgi:hypothetical protein